MNPQSLQLPSHRGVKPENQTTALKAQRSPASFPTTPASAPLCLLFPWSLAAHWEFLQPVCPLSCHISLAGHATLDFICLLPKKASLYPRTQMTCLFPAISHAPGMVLGTQHKHDQMRERMSEIQGWAESLCQKHTAHGSKLRLCPTSSRCAHPPAWL